MKANRIITRRFFLPNGDWYGKIDHDETEIFKTWGDDGKFFINANSREPDEGGYTRYFVEDLRDEKQEKRQDTEIESLKKERDEWKRKVENAELDFEQIYQSASRIYKRYEDERTRTNSLLSLLASRAEQSANDWAMSGNIADKRDAVIRAARELIEETRGIATVPETRINYDLYRRLVVALEKLDGV